MKSSSERTLPSAVSSRPDTSSRTGAATSTVTREAVRGTFEPGVIAVMPGERARSLYRSLTDGEFQDPSGPPPGPVRPIMSQTRGLARTSAALSSVADIPPLGFARAGGPSSRRRPPPPCSCTHQTPLTGAGQPPSLSCNLIDRTGPSAPTGNVRPVATPGTHSRRTGRKPKYIQYEDLRPAHPEHAPDPAP